MKINKVYLKDEKRVYAFTNKRDVFINGVYEGKGVLVTPICKLTLSQRACFTLEGKRMQTGPLRGCYVK